MPISLFVRPAFEQFVGSLPAVTMHEQWESHVAKVGGKVFALLGTDGSGIAFKVEEVSFDGLTTIRGITQAPYFARRQWVLVEKTANLPGNDLRAYIARSHGLVAAKLTRRLRAELGIGEL